MKKPDEQAREEMSEIRQNIAIQEWVIIATERAKRPEQFVQNQKEKTMIVEYKEDCPFCPGNEHLTPAESFALKDEKGNWLIRVVPNKFSALSLEGELVSEEDGIKRRVSGVGHHEVIIESPKHNIITGLQDDHQVVNLLQVYKYRYKEALKDKRVEMVTIFKNHGPGAGTSLEHPHSQMIATPIIPGHIRTRLEVAMRYYDDHHRCVFCDMVKEELRLQERIILDSAHFVAFIPFAALSPFHLWILPKRHFSTYLQIDDTEIEDLALVLKGILKRIYTGLNDPDFNYMIMSLPGNIRENPFFHSYISVIPRVSKMAGFELGSGMYINTALPEKSAEFLRNVKI